MSSKIYEVFIYFFCALCYNKDVKKRKILLTNIISCAIMLKFVVRQKNIY